MATPTKTPSDTTWVSPWMSTIYTGTDPAPRKILKDGSIINITDIESFTKIHKVFQVHHNHGAGAYLRACPNSLPIRKIHFGTFVHSIGMIHKENHHWIVTKTDNQKLKEIHYLFVLKESETETFLAEVVTKISSWVHPRIPFFLEGAMITEGLILLKKSITEDTDNDLEKVGFLSLHFPIVYSEAVIQRNYEKGKPSDSIFLQRGLVVTEQSFIEVEKSEKTMQVVSEEGVDLQSHPSLHYSHLLAFLDYQERIEVLGDVKVQDQLWHLVPRVNLANFKTSHGFHYLFVLGKIREKILLKEISLN